MILRGLSDFFQRLAKRTIKKNSLDHLPNDVILEGVMSHLDIWDILALRQVILNSLRGELPFSHGEPRSANDFMSSLTMHGSGSACCCTRRTFPYHLFLQHLVTHPLACRA